MGQKVSMPLDSLRLGLSLECLRHLARPWIGLKKKQKKTGTDIYGCQLMNPDDFDDFFFMKYLVNYWMDCHRIWFISLSAWTVITLVIL